MEFELKRSVNGFAIKYSWAVLVLLCVLVTIGSSCGPERSSGTPSSTLPIVSIPQFNADSAYANIEDQLEFGFRVPGTPAHRACGEWLIKKFTEYGWDVKSQPFEASFLGRTGVPSFNIIASHRPEHPIRILLAAHWDSRAVADKESEEDRRTQPIAGADDGASGVAVLLELARIISANSLDLGVDIVLFDAEDQGEAGSDDFTQWGIGSQFWSKKAFSDGYTARYGILLDMVGSENATFGKEEFSMRFAPDVVEKIWTLASRMGYSDYFQNWGSGAVTDDHYFVNTIAKIPMIDIINISPVDRRSFGSYHHTHADNIDVISKRTLKVVGQVVLTALYRESAGTL